MTVDPERKRHFILAYWKLGNVENWIEEKTDSFRNGAILLTFTSGQYFYHKRDEFKSENRTMHAFKATNQTELKEEKTVSHLIEGDEGEENATPMFCIGMELIKKSEMI